MQPPATHAGSHAQLQLVDDALASVECHSSKPCPPGLDTGHFW
jgi:hypothetical protein